MERPAAQDQEDRKRELRAHMRTRRAEVSPGEADAAELRLAELARGLLDEQAPESALLYAPLPGELPTLALDRLLRAAKVRVAYPRVAGERELALHLAAPEELAPGRFGIPEPAAAAPAIEPGELGWIVLPGLAFDLAGGRVGFGQGYYDTLCERAPQALRIGAAYPWQIVPEVPAAPHDQRVDLLLADRAHETKARPHPGPQTGRSART